LRTINLGGSRRPVSGGRGTQTEAIFDGDSEPRQQSARNPPETLPGRNGVVALRPACRLAGAKRVEADYHDGIDAIERAVKRGHGTIIANALDFSDLMTREGFRLFREGLEIRLLNVVQKAGDALIDAAAIRKTFEFWVKNSAQLENSWKAIVDDVEWCTSLRWAAPREI
jgi:hypothetical protein